MIECPQCKGNGKYTSDKAHVFICNVCSGTGKVTPETAATYGERVDREITAFLRKSK